MTLVVGLHRLLSVHVSGKVQKGGGRKIRPHSLYWVLQALSLPDHFPALGLHYAEDLGEETELPLCKEQACHFSI